MGGAGIDSLGAVRFECLGRLSQGAGRIDHVIENNCYLVADITDEVHYFGDVRAGTAFVNYGKRVFQAFGKRTCSLGAAGVRGYHYDLFAFEAVFEVVKYNRGGVQVVDRDIEKTLYLSGMQVNCDDPVDTGSRDEIGNQLGGDRGARRSLAVLAGIAVIGNYRGYGCCRCPFQRVGYNEQFHQVVIGWRTG